MAEQKNKIEVINPHDKLFRNTYGTKENARELGSGFAYCVVIGGGDHLVTKALKTLPAGPGFKEWVRSDFVFLFLLYVYMKE